MDRRQSRVTRCSTIAALLFEMIEECQDRIAAEIVN
jgi:hypothetical protein